MGKPKGYPAWNKGMRGVRFNTGRTLFKKGEINSPICRFTKEENDILQKYYSNVSKVELMSMLPNRSWKNIINRCYNLRKKGLHIPSRVTLHSDIKILNNFSKGWMAAILDGEGSIFVRNLTGAQFCNLTVANTNIALLERAKSICGTGRIDVYGRKEKISKYGIKQNKPLGKFILQKTPDVLKLLLQIYPHLIEKRKRAEEAIDMCNAKLGRYTFLDSDITNMLKKHYDHHRNR